MEQTGKTASWLDEDFMEATIDPNVSVSVVSEEVPTMTVATIVGVTVVILVTIALVFLLGVLIDWRQQRLLEKQLGESKRIRNQRRVTSTNPEDEDATIANNMEESAMSTPPADALRSIP